MDKRHEANRRVKKQITDALFQLMHEKSFSKISITDIVTYGHVARASFYRNYDSKEDILITLIYDVLDNFKNTADYDLSDYRSLHHVQRAFEYFKQYDKYLLDLYHGGFATTLLEALNHFHEENAGIMPANSIEKYNLYLFIGALYNTGMVWLENQALESPADLALVFCRYLEIPTA